MELVLGILRLLPLELVGNATFQDEEIDETLPTNMRVALQRIHKAGFVHGDIGRRNLCSTDSGDVFLVDLERCQLSRNPSELGDEVNEVNEL